MIEHGYAPATVNRNISQIGSLYKWAARRRIVPVGFRSPTLGMVRTIKDRRFAVLIRLLVDTGARRGEVTDRATCCHIRTLRSNPA